VEAGEKNEHKKLRKFKRSNEREVREKREAIQKRGEGNGKGKRKKRKLVRKKQEEKFAQKATTR
jgi:hypothetical protein